MSMTRSAHGLDTGTESRVTPCTLRPAGWDLGHGGPKHRYATAYYAVAACRRCPAIDWCARQDPPEHDCVQAGRVWWRTNPYDLGAFHRLTHDGRSHD